MSEKWPELFHLQYSFDYRELAGNHGGMGPYQANTRVDSARISHAINTTGAVWGT
jgi:hypothetical protein